MSGGSRLRLMSFSAIALITMMAGAQSVHIIYKPLDDLNELIEEALKKRLAEKE